MSEYFISGDFGEFTCRNCRMTFQKASADHGSTGLCCQCQIAFGEIKIHATDEENKQEERRTRHMLEVYKAAFPNG